MEQLFNDLQQHIATHLVDVISLIDEDCGQLESLASGEDRYPLTFPCILIGTPEVLWENLAGNLQHGRCTLTVRLGFNCYEDTHYGSTQEHYAAERMRMSSRLNSALHGWRFDGCVTVMIRRASRQFSLPGGIKVYETEYIATVEDKIQNENDS